MDPILTHRCAPRAGQLRGFLSALLLLALGVLSTPVEAGARRSLAYLFPMDHLESFAFELSTVSQTRLVRKPADASRFDLAKVEERLSDVRTRTRGRLDRSLARVFRDSSLGLILRVVDLEGSVARGPGGEAAELDLSGLEGKSVALRLHASGELLDSHGWSHLLGAQRPGSVLGDLFLQSTLHLPAHLPKPNGSVARSFRTRVPVDASLQRDRTWTLSFTRSVAPEGCGRGCVALSYAGTVLEQSTDTHPARPMGLRGTAVVAGQLVLRGRKGRLVSHTWDREWTNTITSQTAAGRTRGEVVQILREEGSIRALGEGSGDSSRGGGP